MTTVLELQRLPLESDAPEFDTLSPQMGCGPSCGPTCGPSCGPTCGPSCSPQGSAVDATSVTQFLP